MNIAYIISITCLAFCLFFFFYFKWYIKRRTSNKEIFAEYQAEAYRLIAEINSVTDRNVQLVEDRIKQLKAVLDDTDRRIAVYARELDRSRTGEALYTSLGRGIRAALKTQAEPAPLKDAPAAEAQRTAAAVQSTLAAAPPSVKPAAAPPAEQVPKTPSKRQIRAQIEVLVNEGLAPGEIASRLGISLAEVDLAMNLMRRSKNN